MRGISVDEELLQKMISALKRALNRSAEYYKHDISPPLANKYLELCQFWLLPAVLLCYQAGQKPVNEMWLPR